MKTNENKTTIVVNENLFLDTKDFFLENDRLTTYKTNRIESKKRYCFRDKGTECGFTMFEVSEDVDSFYLHFNNEKGHVNSSIEFIVHVYKEFIDEVVSQWDLYVIDGYSRSMKKQIAHYNKTQVQ